jgi:23S rRNA-/tRNA-specific pseudouridylate synthase
VHLEHAGFPIVGDKRYGGRPKGQLPDHLAATAAHHQMLHARAISFTLAGHAEAIAIEAPYSDPWRTFLREAFGQE